MWYCVIDFLCSPNFKDLFMNELHISIDITLMNSTILLSYRIMQEIHLSIHLKYDLIVFDFIDCKFYTCI